MNPIFTHTSGCHGLVMLTPNNLHQAHIHTQPQILLDQHLLWSSLVHCTFCLTLVHVHDYCSSTQPDLPPDNPHVCHVDRCCCIASLIKTTALAPVITSVNCNLAQESPKLPYKAGSQGQVLHKPADGVTQSRNSDWPTAVSYLTCACNSLPQPGPPPTACELVGVVVQAGPSCTLSLFSFLLVCAPLDRPVPWTCPHVCR